MNNIQYFVLLRRRESGEKCTSSNVFLNGSFAAKAPCFAGENISTTEQATTGSFSTFLSKRYKKKRSLGLEPSPIPFYFRFDVSFKNIGSRIL
jgi:hypothetical protein